MRRIRDATARSSDAIIGPSAATLHLAGATIEKSRATGETADATSHLSHATGGSSRLTSDLSHATRRPADGRNIPRGIGNLVRPGRLKGVCRAIGGRSRSLASLPARASGRARGQEIFHG